MRLSNSVRATEASSVSGGQVITPRCITPATKICSSDEICIARYSSRSQVTIHGPRTLSTVVDRGHGQGLANPRISRGEDPIDRSGEDRGPDVPATISLELELLDQTFVLGMAESDCDQDQVRRNREVV